MSPQKQCCGGGREGSSCLMSTECEFGKTNIWRRRVVMVAQQWESTWCQWNLHLKMVKLIHFMYTLPQLKERISRTYGKTTPIYRRLAIQIPKKMLRQCLYITKGRFNWCECFPAGCSQLRDGSPLHSCHQQGLAAFQTFLYLIWALSRLLFILLHGDLSFMVSRWGVYD